MNIKSVKLHQPTPEEAGGMIVPPVFLLTFKEGNTVSVPHDPRNRHYQEIAIWYKAQKVKPFKHKFEA